MVAVKSAQVDYKTIKFGPDNNFVMQVRANLDLDPKDQYLEINTCFPMNKWFGIGFGGNLMANSEIIMFISAPSPE